MEKKQTPQETGSPDTEGALMLTRLETVSQILLESKIESEMYMNEAGMPFLLVRGEDEGQFRLMAAPVDEAQKNFMLVAAAGVLGDFETEGPVTVNLDAMALCAQFNSASLFGYAVYLVEEGLVELRAQQLFDDNTLTAERLSLWLALFYDNATELLTLWDEITE